MKRWYQWFYLSLGFAAAGILNYLDGKRIASAVMQVSIAAILGLIQFLCDKKEEKGKKVFKYLSIAAVILLIVWMIYLVLRVLR